MGRRNFFEKHVGDHVRLQAESGCLDPGVVVQLAKGSFFSRAGSHMRRSRSGWMGHCRGRMTLDARRGVLHPAGQVITCRPRLRAGRGRVEGRGGNGGRVAVMWAHESAPRIAFYILWMNVVGPIFWRRLGRPELVGFPAWAAACAFLSPATGGSRSECVPLLLSGSRGSWVRLYIPILSQVVNPLGLSAGWRRRCGGGIVAFPLCGFSR